MDSFEFVIDGVLLNAVGAAGLLGNPLSVLVLRHQMRCFFNYLLMALAVSDSVIILSLMWTIGTNSISGYTQAFDYYSWDPFNIYVFIFGTVAWTMSLYLTLALSVERWLAMCHPSRAVTWCTYSRARWWVLGTAAFTILCNLPKFLSLIMSMHLQAYHQRIDQIFMDVVPFSALAVLNTCIVRQMWCERAERAQRTCVRQREFGFAIVLLVIVLLLLFLYLLPRLISFLCVYIDIFDGIFLPLSFISNLLWIINRSINFIVYFSFSEEFKRAFLDMFSVRNSQDATPTALVTLPHD